MAQSASSVVSFDTPLEVPGERLPRHIAIIMDGNGRWAGERGLPRVEGHRAGAGAVDEVVRACGHLGIEYLTLYSFSLENWKRPQDEVSTLMGLYVEYLAKEREQLRENNVRFLQIGRREGLPRAVLAAAEATVEATRECTGLTLVLALNYGSRAEIVDAMRAVARRAASGEIEVEEIDEAMVAGHLYTAGMPDPDLLIRTAGEKRISNYLLWQISYAELHVSEVYWPDFGVAELHAAIRDYAGRDRRFGGIEPPE